MRTRSLKVTLVCLVLSAAAIAQVQFNRKMTISVPFDFVVSDLVMPKGNYAVSMDTDGRRMLIQNTDEPQYSTFVLNTDVGLPPFTTHAISKMIFARNNGQHVLHRIAVQGDNHTHDIVHGSDVIELVPAK